MHKLMLLLGLTSLLTLTNAACAANAPPGYPADAGYQTPIIRNIQKFGCEQSTYNYVPVDSIKECTDWTIENKVKGIFHKESRNETCWLVGAIPQGGNASWIKCSIEYPRIKDSAGNTLEWRYYERDTLHLKGYALVAFVVVN